MSLQVPIAEAKKSFADLIRRAEAGEEIELTRYGRPVARLVAPAAAPPKRSLLGLMVGKGVSPDLGQGDAEVLAMFDDATEDDALDLSK